MRFRKWTADDIIPLAKLEQEIFPDPWSVYAITEALMHDLFHGTILESDDGQIIGYYGFYSFPPEAHVANVAIVPSFQGKGFGKLLFEKLLEEAENLDDIDLTLEVRPSNEKAVRLYETHGFATEGRRKKYYGDGEDALIMWRRGRKAK